MQYENLILHDSGICYWFCDKNMFFLLKIHSPLSLKLGAVFPLKPEDKLKYDPESMSKTWKVQHTTIR